MMRSISSTLVTSSERFWRRLDSAVRDTAPSGSANQNASPRQTEALLPKDLSPAGQGASQQDVQGTTQEQSRLVDDIRQTAEKANAYLKEADTHLEFKVSEQTGKVVVSVVNSDTSEIVRQIPPESMVRVADRMTHMRGLLFDISG